MPFSSIIFSTLSNYSRQLAFAIAPIPAYLPQYYTLCRSSNDPVLERRVSQSHITFDNNDDKFKGGPPPIGLTMGGVSSGRTHNITESGFSSTSIVILLMSHVFRLQYFLGSAIINTFSEGKGDKVQFDLVTQSLVMVGMQVLLLSAVTRRRRMAKKMKRDDQFMTVGPISAKESSISQKPFIWLIRPHRYWQWDTVHQYVELVIVLTIMLYLFFRCYMYQSDFLEYIITVKIISVLLESCLALPQIILNYRRRSTEGLSLIMVLGWVVGDLLKMVYFILGSGVLKKSHEVSTVVNPVNESEEAYDMSIFIFGSISALVMDAVVGVQVTFFYPSSEMITLQKKLKDLWRGFEIRVLQIDSATTTPKKSRTSSIDSFGEHVSSC